MLQQPLAYVNQPLTALDGLLGGLAGRVEYAQLLNDASEVQIVTPPANQSSYAAMPEDTVIAQLPIIKPKVSVPVLELFLK